MPNEQNVNPETILDLLRAKLPDILLALVIIVVFWIISKIFRRIVYKILDKNSPNSNIGRVLSSIVKNAMS